MTTKHDIDVTQDRPTSRPFVPTDEQRHNDAMLKMMHDAGYTEQQVIDVLASEVNRLQDDVLARNLNCTCPIKLDLGSLKSFLSMKHTKL